MKEDDIGSILKRIRCERGFTLQTLSRMTDDKIAPGNISRLENHGSGVTLKTLAILAQALGTSPSEVLKEAEGGDKVTTRQTFNVPVLAWNEIDMWLQSSEKLHVGTREKWTSAPSSASKRAFGLQVLEDSMQAPVGKSFPKGCYIIVDPEKITDNQSFLIACVQGSYTFKQWVIDGPYQYLKPLNPTYQAIDVTHSNLFVCGTVIAWGEGYATDYANE